MDFIKQKLERKSSFSQKRANTQDPDESTYSLLTDSNMSNYNEALKLAKQEKIKGYKEKQILKSFQKRLKICSTFFLFFALFIMLNSCIGFSSAPFYEHDTKCNRQEPTDDCQTLWDLTTLMYSFEMAGSLFLFVQGIICFALADHIKSMKLAKALNRYTKYIIIVYSILIICRVGVFIKIHYEVTLVDELNNDQGFGSFLGAFVDDKAGAVIVTIILMFMFLLCYLINFFTIRISNNLQKYLVPLMQQSLTSINPVLSQEEQNAKMTLNKSSESENSKYKNETEPEEVKDDQYFYDGKK